MMPLLYSKSFTIVVPMAQVAVLSMYFKAISLPVAYVTLAHGDSVAYFFLETAYDIILVTLIIIGFNNWGLQGTGLALTVSYLLDLIMILIYAHIRYHYVISSQVIRYSLIQLPLGILAYAVTFITCDWLYILLGALLCIGSCSASAYILYRKTSLLNKLKEKYLKRNE